MAHRVSSPADGTEIVYDLSPGLDRFPAGTVPIMLLHGSVLSRAIWRGLGYMEALGAEHPLLRVDLRGHGASGAPAEPAAYATDRQVEDILAVLDDADIGSAHLLGYSLGARVALATAVAAPERVQRLVLLGGSAADQHGALDAVFFPGVVERIAEKGMEDFCDMQGLTADAPGRISRATRQAFLTADPRAMSALFAATDATEAIPDTVLGQLPHPALWMTGTEDQPRFEQSRHAAQTMPHGRFVPLPGRTHGQTLWPAGDVLAEVLPFLR